MKRIITILLVLVLAFQLVACGKQMEDDTQKKLTIVTTIFPEYDWTREILGDELNHTELTMLLNNGVDLHSYQPSAEDIMKLSSCDLFIYVGGESDAWVEDALKEKVNKDMVVINLMDVLKDKIKEEEIIEGMQADEEEQEETVEHDSGEKVGELEYDEHVWLSLRNAEIISNEIAGKLSVIDPDNAKVYEENCKSYISKLDKLDQEYTKTVDESDHKTLIFGDRFPFRYLTDDYGLNYYAAFVGCSAETEASFETITFLAGKMDEIKSGCILTLEGTRHKIAETILENTQDKNQKVLTMDSMQSVTSEDVEKGAKYLTIMEENLTVLKEALK